jgi:hypothetical protein
MRREQASQRELLDNDACRKKARVYAYFVAK